MSISANQIKELRNKSGAGMLDCKKALEENNSNIEDAVAWLRKKGLASAGKKAGRDTSEGVIATYIDGNNATIIELSSETDFVGKNDKFLNLADKVVKSAHQFEGDDTNQFLEYFNDLNKCTDYKKNEFVLKHFFLSKDPSLRKKVEVDNPIMTKN